MWRTNSRVTRRAVLAAVATGSIGATGAVTVAADEHDDARERAQEHVSEPRRRIPNVSASNGIAVIMDCDRIQIVGDDRNVGEIYLSGAWCDNGVPGVPGTGMGVIPDPSFPIDISQEEARHYTDIPPEGLITSVRVLDQGFRDLAGGGVPSRCQEPIRDC